MLLQTFSAGHCKAVIQYNTIIMLSLQPLLCRSLSSSGSKHRAKKDLYKQMLIQEMQSHAASNEVTVGQAEKKKDDFYDFQ